MNALIAPAAVVGRVPHAFSPLLNNGARPSRRDHPPARSVWSAPPGRRFRWLETRAAASRRTPKRCASLCVLLLALFGGPLSALAQPFSLPWHTVDAGGGTSTGGGFTVRGTIGQPDAGQMSGGGFTVTGGFWAWPQVIQTPGAPTLAIARGAPGQAVVSWAPAPDGWFLQEAPAVQGPWTPVPGGSTSPVTVPATFPAKFYRLVKP